MNNYFTKTHQPSNYFVVNSKWNDIGDAIDEEQIQRNQDLVLLMQNVDQTIMNISSSCANKNQIIIMENNRLQISSDHITNTLNSAQHTKNKYMKEKSEEISSYCSHIQNNNKKFNESTQKQIFRALDSMRQDAQNQNITMKNNMNQSYDQFKRNRKQLFEYLRTSKQGFTNSLEYISDSFQEEMREIESILQEKKLMEQQNQIKQDFMINQINRDLEQLLDEEHKNGEITYDSLLTVIEDTWSYLHEKFIAQ